MEFRRVAAGRAPEAGLEFRRRHPTVLEHSHELKKQSGFRSK
jgi:hypothetical protein